MKRRVKAENILLGIIITALLIGALIGSLIAIGVISAKAASEESSVRELGSVSAIKKEAVEIIKKELEKATEVPEASEAPEAQVEADPIQDEKKMTDHPVGVCEITAYCSCVKCCGIWSADHPSRQGTGYVQKTATGTIPTEGRTVAVDKDVIPLGSIVIIDGVTYIAEDTGSAVNGNIVDIYFDSHEEAVQFGRRTAQVTYVK